MAATALPSQALKTMWKSAYRNKGTGNHNKGTGNHNKGTDNHNKGTDNKVGELSVVYTGDFNSTADRHLGAAAIDSLRPDLLITETT